MKYVPLLRAPLIKWNMSFGRKLQLLHAWLIQVIHSWRLPGSLPARQVQEKLGDPAGWTPARNELLEKSEKSADSGLRHSTTTNGREGRGCERPSAGRLRRMKDRNSSHQGLILSSFICSIYSFKIMFSLLSHVILLWFLCLVIWVSRMFRSFPHFNTDSEFVVQLETRQRPYHDRVHKAFFVLLRVQTASSW